MNRLIFMLLLIGTSFCTFAQTEVGTDSVTHQVKYRHYCSVTMLISMRGGYTALVDFGLNNRDLNGEIVESNKKVRFATDMSAVNYMARRGWQFYQFADIDAPSVAKAAFGQVARDIKYRTFFMYKDVSSDAEVRQGITVSAE